MRYAPILLMFFCSSSIIANAVDDGLDRDALYDCFVLAAEIQREKDIGDKYKRMASHADKRLREVTDRNYQNELRRDINKYRNKVNRVADSLNNYTIPRYEKQCAKKSVDWESYKAICNTREKLKKNPFCKGVPEFANDMKKAKGWK